MAKFDWQRYVFEDCYGQLREIRGCPLTKLDRLKDYLVLLQEAIDKYPEPEAHFKEVYTTSGYIKNLTDSILNLCGVSPDWVSLDQMVGLVHHRKGDDDGTFLPGLLVEMNFPSRAGGSGKAVEFKEWVANNIVLLVGLGLCKDLGEALDLADRVPSDQLESLILARLHQLDPKKKQQEELEELNNQPNSEDETVLNFAAMQWQDIDLEKYLGV